MIPGMWTRRWLWERACRLTQAINSRAYRLNQWACGRCQQYPRLDDSHHHRRTNS